MNNEAKLPKTQAAAMTVLVDGMSRDEWAAAGANLNAIDALGRKGVVRREGNPIVETVRYHRAV